MAARLPANRRATLAIGRAFYRSSVAPTGVTLHGVAVCVEPCRCMPGAFDRYVARPRFDQVGLAFSVTVVLFVKAFRFL